jgi:hypothetical protein
VVFAVAVIVEPCKDPVGGGHNVVSLADVAVPEILVEFVSWYSVELEEETVVLLVVAPVPEA